MRPHSIFRLLVLVTSLAMPLGACSVVATPIAFRGNKPDPALLKELVIGTTTKTDVISLIGSPTARATFDDNQWLYISETTQIRIGRTPGIRAQDVVQLDFDQGGVLRKLRPYTQEDGREVSVVSRATPSPGSEASFLQQLFGNVGKFTTGPTGLGGGSGGSTGPGSSGAGGQQGL